MEIIKSTAVAFLATLFCVWLLKPVAVHIGLVDRPGGRKLHEDNVPLIGGVAMFFGFCFALLTLANSLEPYRGLLAGSGLLVLMGVVDDFSELGSKLRLFGQFLAALMLLLWGHELISHLGNVFFTGQFEFGVLAYPITVITVVAFINAMNMLDGQDGLAGGIALGQILLLLIYSLALHRHADFHVLLVVAVLLIVFLGFNLPILGRKKASIFMGDAGSTFIAYVIAWFAISLSQINVHILHPITILWILAFPLFDLVNVFVYRLRRGESPLRAGRDHIHHLLQARGMRLRYSTALLCGLSVSIGLIGMTLNAYKVNDGLQLIALLCALSLYLMFIKMVRK